VPPFLHENGKKILKWDAQRVLFWPTSPHAKWRQLKALGLLSSQRDAFTIFLVSVSWWLAENQFFSTGFGILCGIVLAISPLQPASKRLIKPDST
jgi:hypothetical protein